jgi:hypothetical protein
MSFKSNEDTMAIMVWSTGAFILLNQDSTPSNLMRGFQPFLLGFQPFLFGLNAVYYLRKV